MDCTQGRRRNRFHSWPKPQNASPISSAPRGYSHPLSNRTTFDSAKFETSFHATSPLFHVGRDAYKGNRGGNLLRNSKRPLLPLPLSFPSFSLHRALIFILLLSNSITGDPPISNFGRCIRQNFFPLSRACRKYSFCSLILSINIVQL